MSARMASATGHMEWEERYNQFDPILDKAIKSLTAIAPGATERGSAEKTDQANQKLVAMERQSFHLARKGRLSGGTKILFGLEYISQKEIYASGMKQLNLRIDSQILSERRSHEQDVRLSFYTSILLYILSTVGWTLVIAQIRKWGAEISTLNTSLRHERDIAEKANQDKSLFLANMSHELRTPMHGILSFARFGQQKFESAPKEKLKTFFDEIFDSGSRLMRLLDDLLDLSKLEAGKVVYSMQEASLIEAVHSVRSEMLALAEEKRLSLEVHAKVQQVDGVFDRDKIMQVLRNLVSNAIKFSTSGTRIHIQLNRTQDCLSCSVSNYGVGIPAGELESIFDKFVQSSNTRTGAGGTGLGLAISKEIVEHHSGRIWAESQVGGETKFTMELPISATDIAGRAA